MYLQGGAIWHPRCGPGPTENGRILNGTGDQNGHCTDTDVSGREFDRMSSSGVSEMQVCVIFVAASCVFIFFVVAVFFMFACCFAVFNALSHS